MLNINGCGFSILNAAVAGDYAHVVSALVGSRTCITYTGSATAEIQFRDWNCWRSRGAIGRSADAIKRCLLIDAWIPFELLNLAAGQSRVVLFTALYDGYSGGAGTVNLSLIVNYDGSNYTLLLKRELLGGAIDYLSFGNITQGTNVHRVQAWVFLDKAFGQIDSGGILTATWTAEQQGVVFPWCVYWSFWGGEVIVPIDAVRVDVDEYDAAATLNESRTNGNPDNGALHCIWEDALDGLKTAGTAWEVVIENGAMTMPSGIPPGNYLMAKVLDDGSAGAAFWMHKTSGGDWIMGRV